MLSVKHVVRTILMLHANACLNVRIFFGMRATSNLIDKVFPMKKDIGEPQGRARGGRARAKAMTSDERVESARKAARARWDAVREEAQDRPEFSDDDILPAAPDMPVAHWRGMLNIVGMDVPCYVLETGEKIIGRTSATELLTGIKGGGALEKYIGVKALEPFINSRLVLERMVPFRLLEVEGLEKAVKGLPADPTPNFSRRRTR